MGENTSIRYDFKKSSHLLFCGAGIFFSLQNNRKFCTIVHISAKSHTIFVLFHIVKNFF